MDANKELVTAGSTPNSELVTAVDGAGESPARGASGTPHPADIAAAQAQIEVLRDQLDQMRREVHRGNVKVIKKLLRGTSVKVGKRV